MAWVKLDDAMPHHPKVMASGPMAFALDVAAGAYTAKHATGGFIPETALNALLPGLRSAKATAAKLVEAGRWEWDREARGWRLVDDGLLVWTSDLRVNLPPEQRDRVLERDGYRCQACLTIDELQIDHVLPVALGGRNEDDNLQTLCGTCNRRKGAMHPDDWVPLQGLVRRDAEKKSRDRQRQVARRSRDRQRDDRGTGVRASGDPDSPPSPLSPTPPIPSTPPREENLSSEPPAAATDPEVSDDAKALTRRLALAVKANKFKVPDRGTKAHGDWLRAMDRLLRLDDPGGPTLVARVIDWATTDDFWKANIQSAPKFREKYPQLRLRMEAESRGPGQQQYGGDERPDGTRRGVM